MRWIPVSDEVTVRASTLAYLVDQVGAPEFGKALLNALREVAPVVEVVAYAFPDGAPPKSVGWIGVHDDVAGRVNSYASGGYQSDPTIMILPPDAKAGQFFHQVRSADSFIDPTYQQVFFGEPKFRTEVAIALKTPRGWTIIKSYLEDSTVNDSTVNQLNELLAILLPLARRHAKSTSRKPSSLRNGTVHSRLSSQLIEKFPTLTPRECEVCTRTILGETSRIIAEKLGIGPNTVVTYRRRAYERVGVSNANEMLKDVL